MDPALLDTDMLSEVLKQRDRQVGAHARQYLRAHGSFAFSAVTRFEMIRGYKHRNAAIALARFLTFCGHSFVLPVTDEVFDRAADLWVAAQLGGHSCGDADLLIVATALDQGRRLITGNERHFAWIPGLQIGNWRLP
jgi:tRNA(fMet)-specific endonuclease VapC